MAEAASTTSVAKNPKQGLSSLFTGNKPIPTNSFWAFLFVGVVVDVLLSDWLPFSGTAFVFMCRSIYWLNGYKTDKMLLTTLTTEILGAIPVVADFSNIAFVIITFLINRAETSKAGASVGGRALRMKVRKELRSRQESRTDKEAQSSGEQGGSSKPASTTSPTNPHVDGIAHMPRGGVLIDARNRFRPPSKNQSREVDEEQYKEAA